MRYTVIENDAFKSNNAVAFTYIDETEPIRYRHFGTSIYLESTATTVVNGFRCVPTNYSDKLDRLYFKIHPFKFSGNEISATPNIVIDSVCLAGTKSSSTHDLWTKIGMPLNDVSKIRVKYDDDLNMYYLDFTGLESYFSNTRIVSITLKPSNSSTLKVPYFFYYSAT